MKPVILSVAIGALAAALFTGMASQSGAEATPSQPRASHVIPVDFRGLWAESPAACLSHNDRRYEISAIHFGSASLDAKITTVQIDGRLAVAKAQAPEGDFTLNMNLVDSNTMRARIGERAPVDLTMCR